MKWCSVKFQLFDIHRILLAMLPSGNNLPLAMLPSGNNLPLTVVPSGNNRHFLCSQVATTDTSCVPKWQQPTLPGFPSGNNLHFLCSQVATTDTSYILKWQQPTLTVFPSGNNLHFPLAPLLSAPGLAVHVGCPRRAARVWRSESLACQGISLRSPLDVW